jgi:hypothetical protein
MAGAGALVQIIFSFFGLIPQHHNMAVVQGNFHLNYTSILDIIFFLISFILIVIFIKTGGPSMMKMMNKPSDK